METYVAPQVIHAHNTLVSGSYHIQYL